MASSPSTPQSSAAGQQPAENLPQLLTDYKFEHPEATNKEVGDHFGISLGKVKNASRKARDEGLVAKGEKTRTAPATSSTPNPKKHNKGFYAGFKGKLNSSSGGAKRLVSDDDDDDSDPDQKIPVEEKFPWLRSEVSQVPILERCDPAAILERNRFMRETAADTAQRRTEGEERDFWGGDSTDFDKKREFLFKAEDLFEAHPENSSLLRADTCRHGGPEPHQPFMNKFQQCLDGLCRQQAKRGQRAPEASEDVVEDFSFLWHFWVDPKNEKTLQAQGKTASAALIPYSGAVDAVIHNDFGRARLLMRLGHWLSAFVRLGKKKFRECYVRPHPETGWAKEEESSAPSSEEKGWSKNLSFRERCARTWTDPGLVYFLDDTISCNCLRKFAARVRHLENKHGKLKVCARCTEHKPEPIGCVCPVCDDAESAWYCSIACLEVDKKPHAAMQCRTNKVKKSPQGGGKEMLEKLEYYESQEDVTRNFMAGWTRNLLRKGDKSVVIDAEESEGPLFQLLYGSGAEMKRVREGGSWLWEPKVVPGRMNSADRATRNSEFVGRFNLAQRRAGGVSGIPRLESWEDARVYMKNMGSAHRHVALAATPELFSTKPEDKNLVRRWRALLISFDSVKLELRKICEENARRPCKRSNGFAMGPNYEKIFREQGFQHPTEDSDEAWRAVDIDRKRMRPAELIDLLNILLVWEGAREAAQLWQAQDCPYGQWFAIYNGIDGAEQISSTVYVACCLSV